jgi:hypothetical protein
MHLIGLGVGSLQEPGAVEGAVDVAVVLELLVVGALLANPAGEIRLLRQLAGGVPVDLELARRLDGLLLALGHHPDKAADSDNLDQARQVGDRALVQVGHGGANAGRADNPPMEHVRQTNVLNVARGAGQLARQVDALDRLADDGVLSRILSLRGVRDGPVELPSADQVAVADALRGVIPGGDDAVLDGQSAGLDVESLARQLQQGGARLGRGLAHCHPAELNRLAASGVALVRSPGGVALDHRDALERHVQLVGRDLGQGGADTGSQLDPSAEDRHLAGGINGQPGVELVGGAAAGALGGVRGSRRGSRAGHRLLLGYFARHGGRRSLRGRRGVWRRCCRGARLRLWLRLGALDAARQTETDHQSAAALEKGAP